MKQGKYSWNDLTNELVSVAARRYGKRDAEDLAQTAVIRLLDKYPKSSRIDPSNRSSPPSKDALPLTRVILKNLITDRSREQERIATVDFATFDLTTVRSSCIEDFSMLGSMREMIGNDLPKSHAAVLRRYVDGDSHKEIASALGMPIGTVKSILHRLRIKAAAKKGI